MKKYSISIISCIVLFITSCSTLRKVKYVEPVTNRVVQIQTDFGNMTIALSDSTPLHRDNFIKLVKEKFYDSLLFHRVIKDFMIQGGDPNSKNAAAGTMLGGGGKDYRVPAEFNENLFHKKGALAAARDGNPEKASSSCQFYIVQGKKFTDNELNQVEMTRLNNRKIPNDIREVYKTIGGTPHLDMGYTVFGEVIEGLEVIDKIAAVQKDNRDRPIQDVRMKVVIIR